MSFPYDLQGHRGARGLRPESTIPAFETALDLEVTTLELDLHLSADGEVVVWHDHIVRPTKCRKVDDGVEAPDPVEAEPADLMISRLTTEQLTSYVCDRNPDPGLLPDQEAAATPLAGDDYHLITLGRLFEFVADYATSPIKTDTQRANAAKVGFNIETKREPAQPEVIGDDFDGTEAGAFEYAILDVVAAHDVADRVIIQSFDHRSLWGVHQVAPNPGARRSDPDRLPSRLRRVG